MQLKCQPDEIRLRLVMDEVRDLLDTGRLIQQIPLPDKPLIICVSTTDTGRDLSVEQDSLELSVRICRQALASLMARTPTRDSLVQQQGELKLALDIDVRRR
jgi:hypothetical protein